MTPGSKQRKLQKSSWVQHEIDLTKYDEAAVANLGVGRKFQKPSVIESLTVFENLEMSLKGGRSVWAALNHRLTAEKKAKIDEILTMIDMTGRAHDMAGSLSHGQKQWLEIRFVAASMRILSIRARF